MLDARRSPTVDLDDPHTWPPRVLNRVEVLAQLQPARLTDQSEVRVPDADEADIPRLFAGYMVRAYHATRLFPHELNMIRTQGLRPLSAELIEDRLEAAVRHKCITSKLYQELRSAHVFVTDEHEHRANKVCCFLPERLVDEQGWAIEPLMAAWGGEGISMSSRAYNISPQLGELGTPAIVVVDLDLSQLTSNVWVSPSLAKMLVGRLLGLAGVGGEVHYYARIPREQVVDIWVPGQPEFDRHDRLSRS